MIAKYIMRKFGFHNLSLVSYMFLCLHVCELSNISMIYLSVCIFLANILWICLSFYDCFTWKL